MIEAKRTDKASYILKRETVQKIREQAAREGKEPLIVVTLQDEDVYILPSSTFDWMAGKLEADESARQGRK